MPLVGRIVIGYINKGFPAEIIMKIILLSLFLLIQSINTFGATTEASYTNLFYAEMGKKSGEDVVVLTNSIQQKYCPANYQYAWRGFLSLGEFKVSKGLCWMASDKSPDITIYDPEAVLFKTSKIPQDKFVKIKSESEKRAEINLGNRVDFDSVANLNRRSPITSLNISEPTGISNSNAPILMDINGKSVLCIKIGVILDCN